MNYESKGVVMIVGPYRGDVEANITTAREVAEHAWQAGFTVICPHTNSGGFREDDEVTRDQYLRGYLKITKLVDGIIVLPGSSTSTGASNEIIQALINEKDMYIPDESGTKFVNVTELIRLVHNYVCLIADVYKENITEYLDKDEVIKDETNN